MQIPRLILSTALASGLLICLAGRSDAGSKADEALIPASNPMAPACDAKCAPPVTKCCNAPCIDYRYRRPCRKVCCECAPPQKLTLCVPDPCCCNSSVKVPVCVPSCCKGKPCVSDRCGLLGRGVVTYQWCCGYKLTVTFKKCGDVTVTYFGS